MLKKILWLTASCFLTVSHAWGSGYRIPEQSINSVGMAGGYIANAEGPDACYFNPANMSWNKDSRQLEASINYIYLPEIDYRDHRTSAFNGSSESEEYFLPLIHFSSQNINSFRMGFSLTYPFGLTKRWNNPFPAAAAREFDLKVIEGNPSVSYKFNDLISAAAGIRLMYAEGKVKSNAVNPPVADIAPLSQLARNLEGDTTEWGYNLALSFRPRKDLNISATYRSQVDLDIKGDAFLIARTPTGTTTFQGEAEVEVATPAVFALGASFSLKQSTMTITWDRTFWSEYEQLDFNYDRSLTGTSLGGFDDPVIKNWKDTDAFRISFSYKNTERLTTMMGIAFDENPVPEAHLGFDLPDSDSVIYSIGFRYRSSDKLEIGFSYLYDDQEKRSVDNNNNLISGEFDKGDAHTINTGLIYTF